MESVSPLFTKQKLSKSISIKPNYINSKIDDSIINILNRTVGGRCSSEGYIKDGSIAITKKSLGQINLGDPNSSIIYNVYFVCEVCHPIEGNIYSCKVENKNKMGIVAYAGYKNIKPIFAIIPRDYIGQDFNYDSIDVDDEIQVKVIGKRFKHNDTTIQIVGEIVSKE